PPAPPPFPYPTLFRSGRAAADAGFFRPLLRLLPDLRIDVARWCAVGDVVFIEWNASATLAWRPLRWSGVDRFFLVEEQAIERVSDRKSTRLNSSHQIN